eukprot:Nitzschia sp. Nitz4//scaffold38_size140716//8275//10148//NITZ4_003126-RA/size140716-augustus-gene-0.131-mRNA-1//-1//CDS//3329550015//7005//frame0
MVRTVRSCGTCDEKFLAVGATSRCETCLRVLESVNDAKTAPPVPSETREKQVDDLLERAVDSSVIVDVPTDTAVEPEVEIVTPPGASNNAADKCFICGILLTNLKRRLDHIKRCSRKHAITGRDVKRNTDLDNFVEQPTSTSSVVTDDSNAPASRNPYARQKTTWHGDATVDLKLAGGSTMSAKNPAPARNLNNVLLAGARRLTKVEQIKAAAAADNESSSSVPGKKRQRTNYYKLRSTACPSFKKIPGTDFVCDGFHYAKRSLTQNYFLTHFHSDHYGGLSSSWDTGVIYCSLPTATLVSQQLGVKQEFLHPLPMNSPTVIASKDKPVTVTLLDANHCPGAVMFLFQVGNRRILHVGDFRWDNNLMMQYPPLREFAESPGLLDDLFLDTTYCNSKYTLPSQHAAIEAVVVEFEKESQRSKREGSKTLHLFGAYTIGKERMYLAIAERFHLKVYVDKRRYRILSALNWPEEKMALLTTTKPESCIWVVPLGDLNMNKLPDYLTTASANQYDHVVGYRPTGWSLGSKPSSSIISTRKNGNITIHSVPYSEHSSFPELVDCLENLRPRRIVPTVDTGKSDEQVSCLLRAMREKQTTIQF